MNCPTKQLAASSTTSCNKFNSKKPQREPLKLLKTLSPLVSAIELGFTLRARLRAFCFSGVPNALLFHNRGVRYRMRVA